MLEDDLHKSIQNLENYERKLSSLWWNFWRGIFYGVGFFIGSAILATALIYLLSRIEGISIVGDLVRWIVDAAKQNG